MRRLRKKIGIFTMMLCMVLLSLIPANVSAEETEPQVLVNGEVICQPFEVKMALGVPYEFVFFVDGASSYRWYRCNDESLSSWREMNDGSTANASYSGTKTNIFKFVRNVEGSIYHLKCIAYFDDGSSVESCVINVAPFTDKVGISAVLNQSMVVVYYIINFMDSVLTFIIANPLLLLAFVIVISGFGVVLLFNMIRDL